MNPMLQKLIDQGFMTEEQAAYLADAIGKKHNIIISGHRGHGTLPLMATLGSVAQGAGKLKPVRNIANDLKDDTVTYYLIGDLKDVDFSSLLTDVLSTEQASIITIKDAEHSFSVMKVLSDVFKAGGKVPMTYQVVECTKDADEVKKIAKIVQIVQNEQGKLEKTTV